MRAAADDVFRSWREMISTRTLGEDLVAGLTVACIAIPLNLALALASGLPPSVGLITGVIAGLVAGLFGSARLQITGPEVALAPLSLEIVRRHGVSGLVVATFVAGALQIFLGAFGVGRVFALIPTSVIGGFMAAIGLLVLQTQTPRLLGLPAELRSVTDLARDPSWIPKVSMVAIALGAIVIAAMVVLPKIKKQIPAVLVGLAVVLLVARGLGLDLPVVGEVSVAAPRPMPPPFGGVDFVKLLPEILALTLLASLDSVLSAMAIDTMGSAKRHSSGHELVAQGLANMASALFGGMPVAGAIVRSTAAIQAGARTRLTPVSQSVALLLAAALASTVIARIPIAALAAVLLVVGLRLIEVRALFRIAAASRFEAAIFVTTAVAIVVTDFVSGVAIGLILSLVHFAHRQREVEVERHVVTDDVGGGVMVARVGGPLFFASRATLEDDLVRVPTGSTVVVDLTDVPLVDYTAASSIRSLARYLSARGVRMALVAPRPEVVRCLDHAEVLVHAAGGRAWPSVDDALAALFGPQTEDPSSTEVVTA